MSLDTLDEASGIARRLVDKESRGHGDVDGALHRLERQFGIGFWQLKHLRSGKAKSCTMDLFLRLRAAYLTVCEAQMNRLQHEIAMERARSTEANGDLENIEAETSRLASQLASVRAKNRGE